MSKYAIYEMFGGRDAPYNIEFCGHLVGSRIWAGDDDPTALMAMARYHIGNESNVADLASWQRRSTNNEKPKATS